jgi:hypothetical protein
MTAMAGARDGGNAYRVVEIGDVTDQSVEAALNHWAREGFRFESIHFVTQPGNRRPSMAFLFFLRAETPAGG